MPAGVESYTGQTVFQIVTDRTFSVCRFEVALKDYFSPQMDSWPEIVVLSTTNIVAQQLGNSFLVGAARHEIATATLNEYSARFDTGRRQETNNITIDNQMNTWTQLYNITFFFTGPGGEFYSDALAGVAANATAAKNFELFMHRAAGLNIYDLSSDEQMQMDGKTEQKTFGVVAIVLISVAGYLVVSCIILAAICGVHRGRRKKDRSRNQQEQNHQCHQQTVTGDYNHEDSTCCDKNQQAYHRDDVYEILSVFDGPHDATQSPSDNKSTENTSDIVVKNQTTRSQNSGDIINENMLIAGGQYPAMAVYEILSVFDGPHDATQSPSDNKSTDNTSDIIVKNQNTRSQNSGDIINENMLIAGGQYPAMAVVPATRASRSSSFSGQQPTPGLSSDNSVSIGSADLRARYHLQPMKSGVTLGDESGKSLQKPNGEGFVASAVQPPLVNATAAVDESDRRWAILTEEFEAAQDLFTDIKVNSRMQLPVNPKRVGEYLRKFLETSPMHAARYKSLSVQGKREVKRLLCDEDMSEVVNLSGASDGAA